MPQSTFEKFLPASGILAGILFAVYALAQRVPSGDKDDALTILRDHSGLNLVSTIAGGLFVVALILFAAGIRSALRSGEPGESSYSSVAYGGAVALAAAVALEAMIVFAMIDAADNRDATTAHVLGTLGAFSWVPWVAAACPMLIATGLGGLRNAVLPKWLAMVTIVLGVMCLLGPLGAVVFMISPLWFIATGVVLVRRESTATAATTGGQAVAV